MRNPLLLLACMLTAIAYCQPDTILVYDVRSQTVNLIPPVFPDTTLSSGNTSFSTGTSGNQVLLSLNPPIANLVPGTQFTDIARLELVFNATTYPARTGVKLFAWSDDTLKNNCSGTMVSANLVLTAAHCIWHRGSYNWIMDSLMAAPAYDNGEYQADYPTSVADKYYLFKTFYDGKDWDDIALLELREPIGLHTGWQGLAFNSDTSFFTENVFHKFSYPGVTSPFDSTRIYNGDTLYYNYGLIDYLQYQHSSLDWLGVINGTMLGIPGKSGSSLFYTDNNKHFVFGVLNFANNYRHYLITRNVYSQFKNIIENHAASVIDLAGSKNPVRVFPNPAVHRVNIEFDNPRNERFSLILYNNQGQPALAIQNITGNLVYVDRTNLPSGLYFFSLYNDKQTYCTGKFVFK